MTRTLDSLVASLAALALAAGCASAPQGQVNRYQGSEGQRATTAEENNKALASSLVMTNLVQTRVNGMLVVQFDLVSKRTFQQGFQWTIDWFDRAGMKIDYGPQNWTPERLAASAAKTIKVVAPSPEATSWRLQVGSRDEVQ